jgi:hypothetical protein
MTPSLMSTQQPSRLTHLTLEAVLAFALVIGVTGCSDKAKPKYEECVKLEATWETVKARDACKEAAKISPDSKYGKLASGKLTYLNEQADKIVAETNKKKAPCKVGKWVTHCKWKGVPRPNFLEAPTYAQCNQEADQVRIIGMTCPDCECADRFVSPYKKEE